MSCSTVAVPYVLKPLLHSLSPSSNRRAQLQRHRVSAGAINPSSKRFTQSVGSVKLVSFANSKLRAAVQAFRGQEEAQVPAIVLIGPRL